LHADVLPGRNPDTAHRPSQLLDGDGREHAEHWHRSEQLDLARADVKRAIQDS
jgi:hypothetical protein